MGKGILALTYTAAALLGWGTANILNKPSPSDDPPPTTGDPSNPKSKPSIDGDQLIEDALATLAQSPSQPGGPSEEQLDNFFADYDRLKAELPPTTDPEQTFRDLFARHAATLNDEAILNGDPAALELAVRYYHWMLEEPGDALSFLSQNPPPGNLTQINLDHFGKDFVEDMGFDRSLAILKTLPGSNDWVIGKQVIRDLAERGSIEDLLKYEQARHSQNPNAVRTALGKQLGESWPTDRGHELIAHLKGGTAASAAVALAKRMDGKSGLQWVLDLAESGALDDNAKRALNNRSLVNSLIDKDGISVDERVKAYQTLGIMKNSSDHFVGVMIIDWKLREFMFNDDDWHFAFRHGEATAAEVLNAAMVAMPDFETRREEVASQLFRQLAEDNQAAAMELIADQSNEDIAWARTNSTRWAFFGVNPNDVHSWTSDTADLNNPHQDNAFHEGWRDRSGSNLSRFGDEYLQWAIALPDGKQRTMALEGIIGSTKSKKPHIAEQARTHLESRP